MRISPMILLLLMACLPLSNVVARTDPTTGKIRLLHMGCAFMRPDHPDPVFLMDPKIDLTMVPAYDLVMEYGDIQRLLRLYLPRTRNDLDDKYDLIFMDGIDASHVGDDLQFWIVDLVQESNLSFVMADAGSGWSFAGSGTSWYITALERILSVDDREGREAGPPSFMMNDFRLVPVDPNHELMRNIPWEEVRFMAMNRPTERLGAKVIARMSDEKPLNRGKPVIAYFDYFNGGRSVSYIMTLQTMAGSLTPGILHFYNWKWHYDVLVHMIYWPAKEPIPEDLTIVHSVRDLISRLCYSRLYTISTVEFAEKVGANLFDVERDLAELDAERRRVDSLYIGNRMEECHDLCMGLGDRYEELIDKAMKAKDKALLWIFIVEWAVVSATSMVTGSILWSLLVRRRLYKEVGQTRLVVDA